MAYDPSLRWGDSKGEGPLTAPKPSPGRFIINGIALFFMAAMRPK